MSFSDDLSRFSRRTLERHKRVLKTSAFDLFSAITLATPVDKGVLRANWVATINRETAEVVEAEDPGGQSTLSAISTTLEQVDINNTIYFSNNLPYAARIEFDGHSAQAPEGMVRVNTARWDAIVTANARLAQRGI